MLNELIQNVIDSCMNMDKQKIFSVEVKKKDAKLYYDYIKDPIHMGEMKNKTKRAGDAYKSSATFLADMDLMKRNAEFFNGLNSEIAEQGRKLLAHA